MSVQNTFNMAQFLEVNGKVDQAIKKYIDVCLDSEKLIRENPGSDVDMKWAIYALGYISDIYGERRDFHKGILWRNAQAGFLEFLNEIKTKELELSLEEKNKKFLEIFKLVHEANQDDQVGESVKKIIKQNEEMQKEEQQREDVLKRMRELEAKHHEEMRESRIVRAVDMIVDHPVVTGLGIGLVFLMVMLALLYFMTKRHPRRAWSPEVEEQMKAFQEYVARFEKTKKEKAEL